MGLSEDEFRHHLRDLVAGSGRSMRGLSAAMGRDAGYVAALLDASRPSRARPTPDDLVRLSDAIGIALVELLETLWAVPRSRLAEELVGLGDAGLVAGRVGGLTAAERREVEDFAAFLAHRRP